MTHVTIYGPIADDHLRQPRNLGMLPGADGVGTVEERATDTLLTISLALATVPGGQRVVRAARFRAFGCGGCIVTGSIVTELVAGPTVDAAQRIDAAAITTALADGLPPEQRYCADLAAEALRLALANAAPGRRVAR
jgi:nitrogen fixation NifU-like protein